MDTPGNVMSTVSLELLSGHQSKYAVESAEFRGSSPSLIMLGLPRVWPECVTLLCMASVGNGRGAADFSFRGSQTIISPRPRLAQAWYGIATNGPVFFTTPPFASYSSQVAVLVTTVTPFRRP